MAQVVTINNETVVALIEAAAARFTAGNKTAAVQMALRRLLEQDDRSSSLFNAHPGSVRAAAGVDLLAPVLADTLDAASVPLAAALPRARAAKARRPLRLPRHVRR